MLLIKQTLNPLASARLRHLHSPVTGTLLAPLPLCNSRQKTQWHSQCRSPLLPSAAQLACRYADNCGGRGLDSAAEPARHDTLICTVLQLLHQPCSWPELFLDAAGWAVPASNVTLTFAGSAAHAGTKNCPCCRSSAGTQPGSVRSGELRIC